MFFDRQALFSFLDFFSLALYKSKTNLQRKINVKQKGLTENLPFLSSQKFDQIGSSSLQGCEETKHKKFVVSKACAIQPVEKSFHTLSVSTLLCRDSFEPSSKGGKISRRMKKISAKDSH